MRTLLTRWPRSRGLTMIELLTVVALLALLVALVVAFMFPSDDRRVKQEAEKLAAYCEAAGGEAKMSEGAVRGALCQPAASCGGSATRAFSASAPLSRVSKERGPSGLPSS